MSSDVYCAICAGPFNGIFFQHGNLPRGKYTFARLKPETRRTASEQGEGDESEGDGNNDLNSNQDRVDVDKEISDWELEGCYDDRAVSREESQWMQRVQVLGYNATIFQLQKSFLSGVGDGEVIDISRVQVPPGDDPNFPSDDIYNGTASVPVYSVLDKDEIPSIPFHLDCYTLLRRAILMQTGRDTVHHDALYNLLIGLTRSRDGQRLEIKYGEPEPLNERSWIIQRGREVHLANPVKITGLDKKLKELPRSGTLLSNVRETPPWFWEADSLPDDVDFGALGNALKTWASFDVMETSLENIRNGTLLGLANRRRIWGVAEYLAREYATATSSLDVQLALAGEAERWIRAQTIIRQLPPTLLPDPRKERDKRQEHCFFVKSWDDIHDGARLALYWNLDGALVGMAKGDNLFGNSQPPDGRTDVITIPPGDWLQAITLSFGGTILDLHSCSAREHKAWIAGVSIYTTSGVKHEAGIVSGPKRLLTVSPSNTFVGISGQTNPNGISRFGILECPRKEDTSSPPVLEAEKLLWKDEVIPSNIRAVPFKAGYWKFIPLDFVQQETIIFGTTHEALSRVHRLGVCVAVRGQLRAFRDGEKSRKTYSPVGLTVEYKGQERRTIGLYVEERMNWFDIDGEAGERLSRIGIGMNELPKRLEVC